MIVSMYHASTPLFIRFLTSLSDVLGKAAAHASARNIDPATLLNMRLYPDMYTLAQQVQQATVYAVSGVARPAGIERPELGGGETSFSELQARIAKAISFLKSVSPDRLDGTDDKDITIVFHGADKIFKAQDYLLSFCLPSFYFHCTTAFAILRHCGIEIGKADFMGVPVASADLSAAAR
jgi:hypothetical protein